jgi:hypothetical protein
MKLQTAQRKRAKIKMGLQGPSGSGKSFSALQIAKGISVNWDSVAVIDTENGSSELYSHLGPYQVLQLSPPFSPERYIEAITTCESAGVQVIIIDSITHEWENLLEYHASMQGNSFANWSKITPRHNAFVQKILQSSAHIICTMRTKQDYILNEKNGKMVPEKVGMKSVQRDGFDYELTIMFDLDIKNNAVASKDRTGLFFGKPECKLSEKTGELIRNWCNAGDEDLDSLRKRIGETRNLQELVNLFNMYPALQEVLKPEFQKRKKLLQVREEVMSKLISNNPPFNLNGKQ